MSELNTKSIFKLELDQVLELLAECAGSQEGKAACRALRPVSDLDDVRHMQAETTAASELCNRRGNPNFGDVFDVPMDFVGMDSAAYYKVIYEEDMFRCELVKGGYVNG